MFAWGSPHSFSCINIHQIPRGMLKTDGEGMLLHWQPCLVTILKSFCLEITYVPYTAPLGLQPCFRIFTVSLIVSLTYGCVLLLWYFVVLNEPDHEKMCLMPYANNKGADQPAHPRSLISAFVVRCLDSIIPILAISKVSFCSWAGWFESYLVANPRIHVFPKHVFNTCISDW